jgi:hypothetical protein
MAKPSKPDARIFPIETRFQMMARRDGGIPRDQAIERAAVEIKKAEPGFDAWLDDGLMHLQRLIAEARPADLSWVEGVNTRSRQLCESAGTLGFGLLSFVANSLCDVLDSIEAGGTCNMETIVCHVDALSLASQNSYRRLTPEQVPDLTEGLRRVVERIVS